MSVRNISIIGSGPSGFYTAYQLVKKCQDTIPLNITIWEKLPTPFGLSRYGVAPDHPEVKNCESTLVKLMEENSKAGSIHRVNFVGNCEINSPRLQELRKHESAVVLSYGCGDDKHLGIPGEFDTLGVVSSRKFVNWYNSYPTLAKATPQEEWQTLDFWQGVKNVGIIGNGNVALDLARVLLLSKAAPHYWDQTDINRDVVKLINSSELSNVKIIGRRDYLASKFTNKEFRELWELEQYGIKGFLQDKYLANVFKSGAPPLDRAGKRRLEMINEFKKPFAQRSLKYQKYLLPPSDSFKQSWEMDYLKSPLEIIKDSQTKKLNKLVLRENEVSETGTISSCKSKELLEYPMDLLITSLGYKGVSIDEPGKLNDIGFNERSGTIDNNAGAVKNSHGEFIPGLFCSGWIKKGANGVIANTMMESFLVAEKVLDYVSTETRGTVKDARSLISCITQIPGSNTSEETPTLVSWADWLVLNNLEVNAAGIRTKIVDTMAMLELVKSHQRAFK